MSSKDPPPPKRKERERERERGRILDAYLCVFFLVQIWGGGGLGFGDHPQEGLAKFGYRSERAN